MQGLVNHALESFLRDTQGSATWQDIARRAGLGFERFEPLLAYPAPLFEAVLAAAATRLRRSDDGLLEDMGTWIVSERSGGRLRRLMRFGGDSFVEFLNSLEELPERARLALPEAALPDMRLVDRGEGRFQLSMDEPFPGAHQVLLGLVRAMADDYGALVMIEREEGGLYIQLLDAGHAEARHFALAVAEK